MDALTIPRLRARLRSPAVTRRLAAEALRDGDEGREARERLGLGDVGRPRGILIWVHAPRGTDPLALVSLRERLEDDVDEVHILLTSDTGPTLSAAQQSELQILHQHPPLETERPVERFLDHWKPDCAVWLHDVDRPLLLDAAARRGIPLFLQDAVAPEVAGGRARNLQRRLLGLFDRILAVDAKQSEGIRGLGAIPARIETTGPLTRVHKPPACIESEREALAAVLHARPAWLAACPAEPEIEPVLRAHAQALRTAHRLLLILVPVADHLGPALAAELTARGWSVARRDAGEDPEGHNDIFVVDCLEELGLCYRLAPVTFLGGTLAGADVLDAMAPATLGSAIVAGAAGGAQEHALARLDAANACRRIPGADALGPTVIDLLSPDAAAQLALNAWDVASEGVKVLDRLAHHLLAALKPRAG